MRSINNKFNKVKTVPATNAPVPPPPPSQYDRGVGDKGIIVSIRLKDTEIFNRMVKVFSALMDDKHTPEWIKEKIQRLVLDELKKG